MQLWSSGQRQRSAKPYNREFKSHQLLKKRKSSLNIGSLVQRIEYGATNAKMQVRVLWESQNVEIAQ